MTHTLTVHGENLVLRELVRERDEQIAALRAMLAELAVSEDVYAYDGYFNAWCVFCGSNEDAAYRAKYDDGAPAHTQDCIVTRARAMLT